VITVTIKNPNHVKQALRQEKQRGIDAAKSSIFQESVRLKGLLRKEIKAGAPGGRVMLPLGPMAAATKKGASARKPLVRLAYMMRFTVFKKVSTWYARLGYVPKRGGNYFPKGSKISWGKILEHQAAGFALSVTPRMRKKFVSMAMGSLGGWKGGGRSGGKTWVYKKQRKGSWQKSGRSGAKMYVEKAKSPFFVRRSSTLKIPARPIIEPFWSAHKSQAMQNLRKNFRDAMKAKVLNA
jgi:hypothetical protein